MMKNSGSLIDGPSVATTIILPVAVRRAAEQRARDG
jgi:hypothetical protein